MRVCPGPPLDGVQTSYLANGGPGCRPSAALPSHRILREHNLFRRRRTSPTEPPRRPRAPDHPDEVCHIDLIYLYIPPRWYYLVDILDGYSRFLVHWSPNLGMRAETVTLTVQEALEGLPERRDGEPRLVHDHGSQFLSAEWRAFVARAGLTDVKTRVAHPESNGRLERLHRTHREEGLTEEDLSAYHKALEGMARWSHYYKTTSVLTRPQKYLHPVGCYRGDPEARLEERARKLGRRIEARRMYWKYAVVKEPEPSQK